jgi:YidC/Oxa1 family membrane protein insertase
MDNIRLVLFVALALVVLMIWQAWEADYGKRPSTPAGAPPAAATQAGRSSAEVPAAPKAGELTAAPAPAQASSEQRIHVVTDVMDMDLGSRGGDLLKVDLLDYPVSSTKKDVPVTLLSDSQGKFFVAQSGLLGPVAAPSHRVMLTPEKTQYRLAPGEQDLKVRLHWSGEGVDIQKILTFHRGSYVVDVAYEIHNGGKEPWKGRLYGQLQHAAWQAQTGSSFVRTFFGAAFHTAQDPYRKLGFPDIQKQSVSVDSQGGWAAILQHYFLTAWIPPQTTNNHFYAQAVEGNRILVGAMTPEIGVAPGQSGSLPMRVYVGPKIQDRLAQIAPGLELTVDYGIFWFLSQPLFWLLEHIHGIIGNWGWSIIILTILVKLAFFHLSATSYKSMANMRRLQPRMTELKERYGDDRQKMSQAMMELYKKEKINPLGGCLPIVVQIPVFIALYWVLVESVELRQAPFVLWLQDLTDPDPYYVLPLLMGATMLIQQKLNPTPVDPLQQKIMMIMPIMFTVFFAFFPAGLVLYWTTNNALSILQQWYITRRLVPATST